MAVPSGKCFRKCGCGQGEGGEAALPATQIQWKSRDVTAHFQTRGMLHLPPRSPRPSPKPRGSQRCPSACWRGMSGKARELVKRICWGKLEDDPCVFKAFRTTQMKNSDLITFAERSFIFKIEGRWSFEEYLCWTIYEEAKHALAYSPWTRNLGKL